MSTGALERCAFVNVESEFAAMSVAIGASATGARAYTATASQGLLFMSEALYNASGLGLPIVMTVANRAIGAPINIWNDHSDAMSQRDSGWIQLYAETNQEAIDLHVQAFRLAEELSVPVMVCMDGFVLTHAMEPLEVPDQAAVDAFVPAFAPRQRLDPDEPVSIGAMVGPEAFTEVRYLAYHRQREALARIPAIAAEFRAAFGRESGGLLHQYRCDGAETVVVALGSVLGTLKDAVDELREAGIAVGVVGLTSFRPFPVAAVRDALAGAARVIVLERAFSVGAGGIVTATCIWRSPVSTRGATRWSRGSAAVRSRGRRCRACSVRRSPGGSSSWSSSTSTASWSTGSSRASVRIRARGQRRRTFCATSALSAPGPTEADTMSTQEIRYFQVGSLAVGNRLLDPAERTVSPRPLAPMPSPAGIGPARGAARRWARVTWSDAALRATAGRLVAVNATGCLEVFSTPYPETSWQMPWLHSLFGNAPAVATGVAAALRASGREDIRVVAQGGDGGTVDIGVGCLSGMFERDDDVLLHLLRQPGDT